MTPEEQRKRLDAARVITAARITKGLFDLIIDGTIKNSNMHNWSKEEKEIAINNINRVVLESCKKDNPEFVERFKDDFDKYSSMLCVDFIQRL